MFSSLYWEQAGDAVKEPVFRLQLLYKQIYCCKLHMSGVIRVSRLFCAARSFLYSVLNIWCLWLFFAERLSVTCV